MIAGGNPSAANPQGTEAYKKEYTFSSDWFTANIPMWEEVLKDVKGKPNVRYLEMGEAMAAPIS